MRNMPEDKKLIVTADDFGLSLAVNEAVERAHRQGILSAASLMVGAPAAEDAVERARKLPSLGVGLHLMLIDGRPVLPSEEVPGLVGPDGRFHTDPFRFGVALYFSPELQRQASNEIDAQFERFLATGLTMDHVNGHRHFHLHPVVLRAIAQTAPRFDRPPVRLPLEPFGPSLRANQDRAVSRLVSWLFYLAQTRRLRRQTILGDLPSNDHVFGLYDSGEMTEDRLLRLLDHLPSGVSEIYSHPATRRWEGPDSPPAGYQPEEELRALISPAVKAKMAENSLKPLSYRRAFDGLEPV
jgi:hopanoid biosynthesis associated protein HpnK